MSNLFTHLASGQLTATDSVSLELVKTDDGVPVSVVITWPDRLTVVRPQDFPQIATRAAVLFADAQARLAALAEGYLAEPRARHLELVTP